jgi:hypothetical protein
MYFAHFGGQNVNTAKRLKLTFLVAGHMAAKTKHVIINYTTKFSVFTSHFI